MLDFELMEFKDVDEKRAPHSGRPFLIARADKNYFDFNARFISASDARR